MNPTESFIVTHLNEIVSILVAGIMGWMGKTLWATIQEQKALKKGVKAMLHDRLYQSCRYYLHQGYVDVEGLANVGVVYEDTTNCMETAPARTCMSEWKACLSGKNTP